MHQLDAILLAVGLLAIGLGLVSRLVRTKPTSEPMVAVALGVVIGPAGFGFVDLQRWGDEPLILEQASRITLSLGLMAIALRLPFDELVASRRTVAILVGILMPMMWLASGALAWWLLGLPIAAAALLGAIVTPTDPIVASTIVIGDFVERRVPARLRRAILAESGFNDGLAAPFALLPLLLLGALPGPGGAIGVVAVAWTVVGALVIGIAGGYAAGWLLREAEERNMVERSSFLAYALALSLGVLGGASLAGAEGLLAVFVAGLAFDRVVSNRDRVAEERITEAVGQFFILPVFVLFGAALPWAAWIDLGWLGVALAAAVLFLRRLPPVLVIARLVPDLRYRHDALFVGWFGPIGVAALYYASLASRHGYEELWAPATLVITASILVHGATADPFIRLYASAEARRRAGARWHRG